MRRGRRGSRLDRFVEGRRGRLDARRVGGVLASLYAGPFTTYLLVVWVAVTVALTFVVPRVQKPTSHL